MPKRQVIVSDHAVLRYLERILEVDIEQLRARLGEEIRAAAAVGAKSYTHGGATFILEKTPSGDLCVVTVITEKMRHGTHHRAAYSRKRGVARSVQL